MPAVPPLPRVSAAPRGPAHLLARSAALFAAMTAGRRARAAARPADPRSADAVIADLAAAVDRIPAELPGLVGALAMRGAVFGAHASRWRRERAVRRGPDLSPRGRRA